MVELTKDLIANFQANATEDNGALNASYLHSPADSEEERSIKTPTIRVISMDDKGKQASFGMYAG